MIIWNIYFSESRDSFLYDKKTLEKKSREKNRERLGIFNEDDIYDSHTKQKELEELKHCTFKPIIHNNPHSKGKDIIFNKLYEVRIKL